MRLASYLHFTKHPGDLPLPVIPGGFQTIVADPPWSFSDLGSRAAPGYPLMEPEDILDLQVDVVAARDAHLYLWVPDTHLELGLRVIDAWGFRFKHQIIWVKMGANGSLHINLGHYFRKAHEVCLYATRGRAKVLDRSIPSVLFAPRTPHSRKPEQLQDMAMRASPGPRLELFARRQRLDWVCWGLEADAPLAPPPAATLAMAPRNDHEFGCDCVSCAPP